MVHAELPARVQIPKQKSNILFLTLCMIQKEIRFCSMVKSFICDWEKLQVSKGW